MLGKRTEPDNARWDQNCDNYDYLGIKLHKSGKTEWWSRIVTNGSEVWQMNVGYYYQQK